MELIERGGFIDSLHAEYERIAEGEGHCVLVSGEAGIGKTSLLRAFTRLHKNDANIYQGTCDALFTPRPLAPLYDVIWQIWGSDWELGGNMNDRASLFTRFFHELGTLKKATIIVFEDIHWADEATLDFIKFLARRITRVHCLFILTYRDDEIHSRHPLRNVLGQLPPDSFSRLQLTPLSKTAVEKLATQKGYSGENVYQISGGNPFYVSEILASYSLGVPDNIRDSILSVYNRQDDKTKQVWEILSVIPTGLEIQYLERMEPQYAQAVAKCLESGILQLKDDLIRFKHELYRRTVETSLSPFFRIALNKKILELFQNDFEKKGEIERIIHHAKNANDYEQVVHYAPLAARKAANLGAHIEAAKLYLSAIEYYQGKDKDILLKLYEPYAYECYLTNKIKEAIIFQTKAHNIWKETEDVENLGNCTWFLSRLWWFDGNRQQAEKYASLAIETLRDTPPSRAKAMTYSNMSQLKMLSEQLIECIYWGDIAIALARELGDEEILCHALNNTGTAQMGVVALKERGENLLRQSLSLALKNSYHEHAARAYANMASIGITTKDYSLAEWALAEGIPYSEERELGSWRSYMLSCKARLQLETGRWKEACEIAAYLMKYEDQAPIIRIGALVVCGTIKMRKGEEDALPMLLEAKKIASEAMELQRIIPALVALLEYEWLTGTTTVEWEAIEIVNVALMNQSGTNYKNNDFDFWLEKTRKQTNPQRERAEGYRLDTPQNAVKAAKAWDEIGAPYERALALFESSDEGKKDALSIVQQLGANAIYEKMKLDMRSSGIKNIPRGLRKTTLANPAQLTDRELAVLELLKEGLQNKEIGSRLFISAKTVDHHISSVLFKLDVNSRVKAVQEALRLGIIK
ncbi:MAG: AAA family ATPase [Bacteroidetes bacterium]|nr:AAA family ATPase [Bacteroidota bacterium]